jgi:hypothetical protein
MITSAADERIQEVRATDDELVVAFVDGRTLSLPLVWYPRLFHASTEQRSDWRLIGDGEGVHWPQIDEDLSAAGLLCGVSDPAARHAGAPNAGDQEDDPRVKTTEAARRFAETLADSYRLVYGQATESAERQQQRAREFSDLLQGNLKEQAETARSNVQLLFEQAGKQQEAEQEFARESVEAYTRFLDEAFSRYRVGTEQAVGNVREGAQMPKRSYRHRPGMPEQSRVVDETVLTPERPSAQATVEPASGTQQYRILRTDEPDPYDVPLQPDEVATLGLERFAGFDDTYRGTARKAATLSIADANVEDFDDIKDLIETLPAIEDMTSHEPPITTDATSGRVDEENRNVRVRGFLYAASREEDNDFQLIVGRDPELEPTYMTIEISGLPPEDSDHFPTLEATREAYKEFFGDDLPGASYDFYDPPIPVEVEGSLFFDMSHSHGSRPGPASLRPDMPTIWQIRPVTNILFKP